MPIRCRIANHHAISQFLVEDCNRFYNDFLEKAEDGNDDIIKICDEIWYDDSSLADKVISSAHGSVEAGYNFTNAPTKNGCSQGCLLSFRANRAKIGKQKF